MPQKVHFWQIFENLTLVVKQYQVIFYRQIKTWKIQMRDVLGNFETL